MKNYLLLNSPAVATLSLTFYLLIIFFSDYSLTGFWTDIIFSALLSVLTLIIAFRRKMTEVWLIITFRFWAIICFGIISFFIYFTIMPFYSETFKLRSFYFQTVDGRLFNAYFKPVGAYAGGYGNFWITESSKYFPIIEKQVYYDRTVDYDFNDDMGEGEPLDNYEVVRNYIREEVINIKKF